MCAPVCRNCGNKGVDMLGKPCRCPAGRALVQLLGNVKQAVDNAWDSDSGKRFREQLGKVIDETPPGELQARLQRGIERLRQQREGEKA